MRSACFFFFFFQAEDGIRDFHVTGVQTCALPICESADAAALPDGLTVRQVDVLRLLAAGLSNKQIAAELSLSPVTIERHLATVYRKLGLGGRVEAARYAVTHGLAAPARML